MSDIKVSPKEGTEEIVIRKGDAQEIRDERTIEISGVLSAPRDFWEKRSGEHEALKTHITYSRDDRRITLYMREDDYFRGKITGLMDDDKELAQYSINGTHMWGVKELMKHLRMRKSHFADREEAAKLISNLSKFKASVQTEIEHSDSQKGDLTQKLQKKVDTDIPLDFTLDMRVFKGMPKKKFKVDIFFDITDAQAQMWFESAELAEIVDKMVNDEIDKELKTFKDVVVIEQ